MEWVSGLGLWFALCCSRCAVKGDLHRGGRVVARWQIEASSWSGWDTVFRTNKSRLLSLEQQRQMLYCARFMRLFHVNI